MDDEPTRVIVYTCVTDIPGDPQRRHNTLGQALCKQVFGREFHAELRPSSYDHVHIPADFDSDQPLKRWFIFDLNVKDQITVEAVSQIPHAVYLASCQSGELIFIPRDVWAEKAKSRAKSYTWGGKMEQKMVDEMRERLAEDCPSPSQGDSGGVIPLHAGHSSSSLSSCQSQTSTR
ncbi:predicted protein [Aspergillus terreus NIH2624]|uniref:Uncharacterized protein n=1 Tax=Aspergillus terreus (strain NIH 2624 / FGSC A1156) TaxID=341663 RepID=Q0CFF2_ASPTN|nr:uncharacterized protein ATEG_07582 [Aspergillus terreus NIH2624]EAU31844.1 predicted protein [Aspergillus terreus NIH2624]